MELIINMANSGKINVLDKAVAELIAAGEVVERPASIVKELVENSIDAGASDVTVEIRGGGIAMIRVADNGGGIIKDDIPKAFLRHATSKVRDAGDLENILTLGFRGEALASIAAMCRVELTTKTDADTEGTTYRMEGGQFVDTYPAGCPTGTTITVRDVFFNTPARMKFLKKDIGEGNAVAQVIEKCALSHPEVAFRFIRDGQVKLRTSGAGDRLAVIMAIYGSELSSQMLPVDYMLDGKIKVTGYIAKPEASRPSRSYQNFFINGRYVRTRTAGTALEEAYKGKLMAGKFPACVLDIGVMAETVDVNVHPAKIEVRFADERPIFSAVFFACKSALAKQPGAVLQDTEIKKPSVDALTLQLPAQQYTQQRLTVKEVRDLFDAGGMEKNAERFRGPATLRSPDIDIYVDDDPAGGVSGAKSGPLPFYDKKPLPLSGNILVEDAVKQPVNDTNRVESIALPTVASKEADEETQYRLIGELFGTYILLEQSGAIAVRNAAARECALILVDKHAAHERLIYEQIIKNISYGNRQILLSPLAVSMPREEYGAVAENLGRLAEMGFLAEDFGDGTVLVREAPIELGENDVVRIMFEIAQKLLGGGRDITPDALDRLYYSIACKSAIRTGDKTSGAELDEIVRALQRNPQITHCPHGRPVSVKISRAELEKMFGRLG